MASISSLDRFSRVGLHSSRERSLSSVQCSTLWVRFTTFPWAPAQNFGAGDHPSSVAVTDFDGDGRLDLAVAYAGASPDDVGGVSVLLGNGDGSLDLVIASPNSAYGSVLLGNGDGSFDLARNFGTDGSARSVAVGDFNSDGWRRWPARHTVSRC